MKKTTFKKIEKTFTELNELWENIDVNIIAELSLKWCEEHILYNKKKEILEYVITSKNYTKSLNEINDFFNKEQKINKSAVLKHLDFLISIKALESKFIISEIKRRERLFTITETGKTILDLCYIIGLQEEVKDFSYLKPK